MFKINNEAEICLILHELSSQIANSSVDDQCINDVSSDQDLCMMLDKINEN